MWHGITIQGLDYLLEENLVGGYMSSSAERLEAKHNTMEHLSRLDRGTWHGFVRFDGIENLEIRREPWHDSHESAAGHSSGSPACSTKLRFATRRSMILMPTDNEPPPLEQFYPNRSFLPDGTPLHGTYALFEGAIYVCRPERNGGSLAPGERVVLLSTAGDAESGWELKPVFGSSPISEWRKVINQSAAEELFSCQARATWRGIEISAPTYLPVGNFIGGFVYHADRDMEPRLQGIHRLERVDQSSWYGYVPLDELEDLEITRRPWPQPITAEPQRSVEAGRGKVWRSRLGQRCGKNSGSAD